MATYNTKAQVESCCEAMLNREMTLPVKKTAMIVSLKITCMIVNDVCFVTISRELRTCSFQNPAVMQLQLVLCLPSATGGAQRGVQLAGAHDRLNAGVPQPHQSLREIRLVSSLGLWGM